MLREDREHSVTSVAEDAPSRSSPSQGSRKRRAPSSNTRGVASLTPEQLAKKRANDREAQRAIRERTKTQIETLERKIQDLTAQRPYQELQAIIRQKDAVQAENEEIKRRLTSILSILQPLVGAQGLTELATAAHSNVQLDIGAHASTSSHNQFLSDEQLQNVGQPMCHHAPATLPPASPLASFTPQWQTSEGQGASSGKIWHSSSDALNQPRPNLHRGLELNESGERLSFNFLLDNKNASSTKIQTQSPPTAAYPPIPGTFSSEHHRPSWAALPKNTPPTCPLDGILIKFLQTRQHEAENGHPQSLLGSPAYPSVSSLLNPTNTRSNSASSIDPLSQVMTDIISKFPGVCGLPQQVAVLYIMFLFMRWCLHPTQENYERMPEWLNPRPSQLFEAHPVWMDYVPWPKMRDKLVANYRDYPFENWFIPFTSGLSVNWPYEATDCLLSTSDGEEPTVNPVFETHLLRLESWSLGPDFVEAFPSLAGLGRVQENRQC